MKKYGTRKASAKSPTAVPQSSMRAKRSDDPLAGPVDFARFGPPRRNAFAGAEQRGGPSLLALWEMPEIPPGVVMMRRGRPRRGEGVETRLCSVRLPKALWEAAGRKAKAKHLNLQQAMRAALMGWIKKAG